MELKIYDLNRTNVRVIDISVLDIEKIRYDLIHKTIVWQASKSRSPVAHTKQVSDVSGSTRKICKQKGTGGARHGSNRRVQFRGGAVAFGPTNERNFQGKINKKERKIALHHAVAHACKRDSLLIIDNLSSQTHKTRDFIGNFKEVTHSKVLFIDDTFDKNFSLASRNVPNVNMIRSAGVNVSDVFRAKMIVLSEAGINSLIKRLG
jgi:large subunit ribosomal protein L4|tara:strand:+ start:636 stop:1253 length:618 start_codon:yes stop_codon:yes gene_type:complete